MSATLEQIRAAIVARLTAIAGIGVVHPYERYAARENDFAALFTAPVTGNIARRLLGWHVRRVATREIAYSALKNRVEHDFVIRGYMALEDGRASEILMDGLVEQVRRAWRIDPGLGGLLDAPIPDGQAVGPQLVESGPYMLGGILCHGVRLQLTAAFLASVEDDPTDFDDFETLHVNWDLPPRTAAPPLPDDADADATDTIALEIAP